MEIPFTIQYVTFRSDSGFAILKAALNNESPQYNYELASQVARRMPVDKYGLYTVTTNSLDVDSNPVGWHCVFMGDYYNHPKFGFQFKSDYFYQEIPTSKEGFRVYLMTLPNIHEKRSKDIVDTFGVVETIRILEQEPLKLTKISGITEKRVPPIKAAWDKTKCQRELFEFLGGHNISPAEGRKIFKEWGINSVSILKNNPYRLTEISGIGFAKADGFAHKIMDEIPIEHRVTACIQYVLTESLYQDSNLCIPFTVLKKQVEINIKNGDEVNQRQSDVNAHIEKIGFCIKSNLNKFSIAQKEVNNVKVNFVYLRSILEQEKFIAFDLLKRHNQKLTRINCSDVDIQDAEDDIKRFSGREIRLDDCQKNAVKSAFENQITVITGPGGTGKSTICRCICYLAEKKSKSVRLLSPTGKAAQVLSEKTRHSAATIHRSLKMKPGDVYPKETIDQDIIIVDEISMVGIDTMFAILYAMASKPNSHIVFVGDANQLPSVSPGNFLSDIIKSNCANIVYLNQIHRQDENSYISIVANDISSGKVTDIPENATDIIWEDVTPSTVEKSINDHVNDFLSTVDESLQKLQVLAPMYRGDAGIDKINSIIQKIMFEKNSTVNTCMEKDFKKFYKGDRVIQLKNNYDKEVYNGDIGIITDLGRKALDKSVNNKKECYIIVDFYGTEKTYVGEEIDELKLAWCISVHKYQGSQSPYIFFVMTTEANRMISKELVYTAFTRAEKQLTVFGNINMLHQAPHRSVITKRFTNIVDFIEEFRSGKKIFKLLYKPLDEKLQGNAESVVE